MIQWEAMLKFIYTGCISDDEKLLLAQNTILTCQFVRIRTFTAELSHLKYSDREEFALTNSLNTGQLLLYAIMLCNLVSGSVSV